MVIFEFIFTADCGEGKNCSPRRLMDVRVSARPYCAPKFTCYVIHRSARLSWTFSDPYFSFHGSFTLLIFYERVH